MTGDGVAVVEMTMLDGVEFYQAIVVEAVTVPPAPMKEKTVGRISTTARGVLWYVARESSTRPPTGKLWRSCMRTADCPPVIFLSPRPHVTFPDSCSLLPAAAARCGEKHALIPTVDLLARTRAVHCWLPHFFSLSIHSRTYAGQFSSFIPSPSQSLRNFTASRSANLSSCKSKTMVL